MAMQVLSVKLPADLLLRVKTVAHLKSVELQKDVTASDLVREALSRYLEART
jgi:hypothetical protein